jgi:hypothetical protein
MPSRMIRDSTSSDRIVLTVPTASRVGARRGVQGDHDGANGEGVQVRASQMQNGSPTVTASSFSVGDRGGEGGVGPGNRHGQWPYTARTQ